MGVGCVRRLDRGVLSTLISYLFVLSVSAFVVAPIVIVFFVSLNEGQYFVFPPRSYSLKWYAESVLRPEWRNAFFFSLWLALASSALSTVVGTLAALGVFRYEFPGRSFLSTLFVSPLMMPGVLTGMAMLHFATRVGIAGSFVALLLGHVLVTFPYVVRLVLAGLPGVGRSAEEAALTLGADELTALVKITLPLIRSSVVSGALLAFILSFDNVMMSLFLATYRVQTLPVKILQTVEWVGDPTIAAISTVFVLVSALLMVVAERTVGLNLGQAVGMQR